MEWNNGNAVLNKEKAVECLNKFGGHDTTPYDYAENGWLFCSRCGTPRDVKDLDNISDEYHKLTGEDYFTRLIADD